MAHTHLVLGERIFLKRVQETSHALVAHLPTPLQSHTDRNVWSLAMRIYIHCTYLYWRLYLSMYTVCLAPRHPIDPSILCHGVMLIKMYNSRKNHELDSLLWP